MRAAGTRVSFKFEMPSRTEQGSGVISADGEDGFLVLDDARFDSGKSAARIWIPLTKLRLLWADELPALSDSSREKSTAGRRGSPVSPGTVLMMGDLVLDRSGYAWSMFSDKRLRSGWFSDEYALTLGELVEMRGPITFHGHDDTDDENDGRDE
ncbi:hypothetical protein [Rhodococcoides fascians]|uniref:hypothetical protein n=1 Tax=Rhodococcoides fascians TaxID=1828 RepID=UPI00055D4DDB|nr:hypothetical protein [Rhodococcus fascians]